MEEIERVIPPESTEIEQEPVEVIEPENVEVKPKHKQDELNSLFEVPQPDDNDMYVDDIVEAPGEDNLDDLIDVSTDDLMGEKPKAKPKYKISSRGRTSINRDNTPTSLGGMRS